MVTWEMGVMVVTRWFDFDEYYTILYNFYLKNDESDKIHVN